MERKHPSEKEIQSAQTKPRERTNSTQKDTEPKEELTEKEREIRTSVSATIKEIRTIFKIDQTQAIGDAIYENSEFQRRKPESQEDYPVYSAASGRERPDNRVEDPEIWEKQRLVEYWERKIGRKRLIKEALRITNEKLDKIKAQVHTSQKKAEKAHAKGQEKEAQKQIKHRDELRKEILLLELRFDNLLPNAAIEDELMSLQQTLKQLGLSKTKIRNKINYAKGLTELDTRVTTTKDLQGIEETG